MSDPGRMPRRQAERERGAGQRDVGGDGRRALFPDLRLINAAAQTASSLGPRKAEMRTPSGEVGRFHKFLVSGPRFAVPLKARRVQVPAPAVDGRYNRRGRGLAPRPPLVEPPISLAGPPLSILGALEISAAPSLRLTVNPFGRANLINPHIFAGLLVPSPGKNTFNRLGILPSDARGNALEAGAGTKFVRGCAGHLLAPLFDDPLCHRSVRQSSFICCFIPDM